MTGGNEPTYFDGLKMSGKQKIFMILLISGTFLEQMDLYNFAILAPGLMKVWNLSVSQIGRIHGAFALGAVLGCIVFGWCADKKGRKTAMAVACISGGTGALLSSIAPNLGLLTIARVISGFGITGALVIEAPFLVEMVPSDKRSKYQGILGMIAITGVPITATLAKKLLLINPENWRFVAAIPSIGILVGILFWFFVPESPRWLISNNRTEEGKKVFKDITGQELSIDPDFECIVDKPSYKEAFRIMFSKDFIKRTMLFAVIFLVVYNAGFMFSQWLPTLLTKEGMSLGQAMKYQQIVTIALIFGPLYVALFGDKGGRKYPYAIAMALVGIGLFGIYKVGLANTGLLTLAVIIAGAFVGTNQIFSTVYTSECYPTRVRVIVLSLFLLCQRGVSILSNTFVAPKLYEGAGFSGYFAFLAVIYFVLAVLILWIGPKTAGKSLEELTGRI